MFYTYTGISKVNNGKLEIIYFVIKQDRNEVSVKLDHPHIGQCRQGRDNFLI